MVNFFCLVLIDVLLIYLVFYINRLGIGLLGVCLYRLCFYVGIYILYLYNWLKLVDIFFFNFFSLLICRFFFFEKSLG